MQAYLRLKRYILPSGIAREALQAAAPHLAAVQVKGDELEEAIRLAEIGEYLYNRSYSYGDGYSEPREYGIEWQWQQTKPNEFGEGVLLGEATRWHKEQAEDGVVTEASKLRHALSILSALEPSAGRAAVLEEAASMLEAKAEAANSRAVSFTEKLSGPLKGRKQSEHWRSEKNHNERIKFYYLKAAAAIRALHPQADKPSDDGAQGIERGKFYHHQWPMGKLLEARRDGLVDHSGGEAWRYEYSHKDEHGRYDILYRPVKNSTIPARLPTPPAGEVA